MKIVDLIKLAASKTIAIRSFGYGPRAYSDVDARKPDLTMFSHPETAFAKEEYPRLWLYPVIVTEDILKSGALQSWYSIDLLLAKQVSLSAPPSDLESSLNELLILSREYILRLKKESGVYEMSQIIKRPAYHVTKQNLIGYTISFRIRIEETISYPC